MINRIKIFFCVAAIASACSPKTDSHSNSNIVKNITEFKEAASNIARGGTITLANGVWTDVEFRLEAVGTADSLITIQAETPGEVIISGQSNLAFSGEYIVVSGLIFKDGYTPTSEVISFKTGKTKLANHSRVTNCVIDNFTNPERFDGDTWVAIYGKNNQFDHNSMIGKGNRGVTLAVKLRTEASQENDHIIENNYFGPREVLGSNGGETMRIGTSHYSRTYSNTAVRKNYFDRTNGEHEIVSNKACGNKFVDNVFFECQGTLTMRHGHHTLVENNYFIGNRKQNTGGIRIINEYQTVQNNYLLGLTGHRFRGALVIMNGVPDSPINRYNQVIDSDMKGNVVLNSDYIQLCAGSDEERSAIPVGSSFVDNIIFTQTNPEPFTIYDDVSGITFSGNVMNEEAALPFQEGFEHLAYEVSENENGLLSPSKALLDQIGFGKIALPVAKDETGASYYSKDGSNRSFDTGKTIKVPAGTNTLLDALAEAEAGDILELENGGTYLMEKYAMVYNPVTIMSPAGDKAIVMSEKQSFFKIENGGALNFNNILFDGVESPDQAGNNVISTSKYSMTKNYAVVLDNCEVKDLDKNHSFDFLKSFKHTFADSIVIINSNFTNVTGAIMTLDMEVEDLGIYNVENVHIENSTFTDVQGAIANVYRGGTDESTFGPIVRIEDVQINNSGNGKRNKVDATFRFHGVQKLDVADVTVENSKGIDLYLTNGEPVSLLADISFINSTGLKTNNNEYESNNISVVKK